MSTDDHNKENTLRKKVKYLKKTIATIHSNN